MGCDIHLAVEVRQPDLTWLNVTPFDDGGSNYPNGYWEDRNYALFAMLANVRNSYDIVPLTDHRGIPEDCAPDIRQWCEDGQHSHSYCTLDELLTYDWTQTMTTTGWVSVTEWVRYVQTGSPESWSSGVGGGAVTHHTPADFLAAWEKLKAAKNWPAERQPSYLREDELEALSLLVENSKGSPYAQLTWETPYFDRATHFLAECLPKLLRLAQGRSYDDVRLVFWFDS